MSSFYSTNEQKQRKYLKERAKEADNEYDQQERVWEAVDKELGLETRASNIGEFSKRVARLANKSVMDTSGDSILASSIKSGTLSELFDKVKLIESSKLTHREDVLRNFLGNNKTTLNEVINENLQHGPDAIKKAIIAAVGDEADTLLSLIEKANKISTKDYQSPNIGKSSLLSRMESKERDAMGDEDINYNVKVPGKPPTKAQLEAQAKAQAELDLISLFQQDVKEGRKRETKMNLERLEEDKDLHIRQVFHNVLGEMKRQNERNKKTAEYKEQKAMLDKIMNLIENQRMYDSFENFSKDRYYDAIADKIQRNLKKAINYKKNMDTINNYISKEAFKQFNKGLTSDSKSGHGDYDSDTTTFEQSLAGEKIDNRAFNPGRAKYTLEQNKKMFDDALNSYKNAAKTSQYNKTMTNIINRMPDGSDKEEMISKKEAAMNARAKKRK
jgi:hypothetical protein